MSLWQSYRNLTPRIRLLFGGGIMAWAVAGLFFSDQVEQAFGLVPTEREKKELKDAMPRVHVLDREKK